MCITLKVRIQQLERLRRETGAPFALLGRLHANEVRQVALARLVPVPVTLI